MRPNGLYLSIPSAARLLGRGNASVRRAVERGAIPSVRIKGCQTRIPASAVAELLEAAGQPARLMNPTPADAAPVRLAEPVGT